MADQNNSGLVTVNQNGVVALGNIANLLQSLNTAVLNRFGVLVSVPANATSAGIVGQFSVNGSSFLWAYGTNTWAKVNGTTVF